MKFNSDELASVIQQEIEQYTSQIDVREVGRVLEVGDGIARVYGLSGVMANEMVEFSNGTIGLAFNLEENSVGIIILGDFLGITEGDEVRSTGRLLSVPVGDELLGRVVDPLGNPLDGKGPIVTTQRRPMEVIATGVAERQPVCEPLQTGLKAVDAMTPIGRGQRELIIGDRKTGKTAVAIDAIINQRDSDVKCFYVAVGQKESTVAGVVEKLRETGAMDYTTVIVAGASTPAPLQYVAAYAGTSMAEHYMFGGGHALIVYDDLSKQAVAYRQLSLLMRTRGVPRRRILLPQSVIGALSQVVRRIGWWFAHLASHYRNARRGSLRVYSYKRNLHHRRADLLAARFIFRRGEAGHERGHLRLTRRRCRADQGHEESRRRFAVGPGRLPRVGGVRPTGN